MSERVLQLNQDTILGNCGSLDKYTETAKKERTLYSKFEVVSVWECEYEQMIRKIQKMRQLINNLLKYCLRSIGRVGLCDKVNGVINPFVLYYPPTKGIKIHYVSLFFLYFYCIKKLSFPNRKST